MSSPLPSIIVGCLVTVLGIMGVLHWWCQVVEFLKGGLSLSLVFAGLIAIAAGISRYVTPAEPDQTNTPPRTGRHPQ